MSVITITKLSGDCSDDTLQFMHFPSGCSTGSVCAPPACTLYTWKQSFVFQNDADNPGCGDSITISNFSSLDLELCSPAGDFPIPELRDTCNILVKAEGNRFQINIGWTLVDEVCTVSPYAPLSIFTPAPCASPAHAAQCISTVQQQLDFFINTFQPNSIEDAFLIEVDGISRMGTFRKMSFNKSESTPITYSCRLEFISGNVVAGEA